MLLEVNAVNPDERKIKQITEALLKGGIIVYPTDTVYGLGCDIFNQEAVEKICQLRGLDPEKAMLSIICKDFSQVAEYTAQIENETFRMMRKNLPGPFTFILKGSNKLPRLFKNKKRTIGIRIPDNKIVLALVESLGRPILTTSLKNDDDIVEYFTDPFDIDEKYGNQIDIVIDGGIGGSDPSGLVDCTGDEPLVIREGVRPLS